MSCCTFQSTWDLNGSWVDALGHSIHEQLGIHSDRAELKANSTASGAKALSEVLGNFCEVSDREAQELVQEAMSRICVYECLGTTRHERKNAVVHFPPGKLRARVNGSMPLSLASLIRFASFLMERKRLSRAEWVQSPPKHAASSDYCQSKLGFDSSL